VGESVSEFPQKPNGGHPRRGAFLSMSCVREVLEGDGEGNEAWRGVVGFDAFRGAICKRLATPWGGQPGLWTDIDTSRAQCWFAEVMQAPVSADMINRALSVVADDNTYNSLADELSSYKFDGTPRLHSWLPDLFTTEDTPLIREYGKRFLIGAVARAFEPGCEMQNLLILEGVEGIYKSRGIRALAGDKFYSDAAINLGKSGQDDAIRLLQGRWMFEFGELAALKTGSYQEVDGFISRTVDTLTPKYNNFSKSFPRITVLWGTTNAGQYLTKSFGNRRYWSAHVMSEIKIDEVAKHRESLIAEAIVAYRAGVPWWLTQDVEVEAKLDQEARYQQDAWEEKVSLYLHVHLQRLRARGFVTVTEMLEALKLKTDRWTRREDMRIAEILHRLGWRRGRQRRDPVTGSRIHPYLCPVPPLQLVRQNNPQRTEIHDASVEEPDASGEVVTEFDTSVTGRDADNSE